MSNRKGYDALAVANWFLDRAASDPDHNGVDHLKLQKLIYIAHGWDLATSGAPLIFQDVQAWPYGPVIPAVYHEFKHCGKLPIADRATVYTHDGERVPAGAEFDTATLAVLNRVWDSYKEYSGIDLTGMTHSTGTPWRNISDGKSKDDYAGTNIPNDGIKQYYVSLGKQNRAKNAG